MTPDDQPQTRSLHYNALEKWDAQIVGMAEVVMGKWKHDPAAVVPRPDSERASSRAASRSASRPRDDVPASGRDVDNRRRRRPGWRDTPLPKRRPSGTPQPHRQHTSPRPCTGKGNAQTGKAYGRGNYRPPSQDSRPAGSSSSDPRRPAVTRSPYADVRLRDRGSALRRLHRSSGGACTRTRRTMSQTLLTLLSPGPRPAPIVWLVPRLPSPRLRACGRTTAARGSAPSAWSPRSRQCPSRCRHWRDRRRRGGPSAGRVPPVAGRASKAERRAPWRPPLGPQLGRPALASRPRLSVPKGCHYVAGCIPRTAISDYYKDYVPCSWQ